MGKIGSFDKSISIYLGEGKCKGVGILGVGIWSGWFVGIFRVVDGIENTVVRAGFDDGDSDG